VSCLCILASLRIPWSELGRQTPHFWDGSVTYPFLFLKTHLVPMTFTSLEGLTKFQTWFLSKFSISPCMALTQLESKKRVQHLKAQRGQQRVYLWNMRDEQILRTMSPFHSEYLRSAKVDGGCAFWMWEGAPDLEMISPWTRDASTVVVEEVVA
jgi:hypothetical protein